MSYRRGRWPLLSLLAVFGILLGGCQSDFAAMDLSFDERNFGFKAQVELDEPFEISLFGNGAYPEAEWQVVEMDSERVQLRDTETIPARAEGVWVGEYEGTFLPVSIFRFTAGSLGETLLVLEVQADG